MNKFLKLFLSFLFTFIFITVARAADNVDYTAKVDCSSWNDTTAQIQQGTTSSLPYLSLKKATEDIFKLNNQHTNSRFWIKIKGNCGFATDNINRIVLNINSWGGATKNNSFFMQPETEEGYFFINVWDAWFLEITTGWSLFQIKNAVFKGWKNWVFISQDWNSAWWLKITDSKFEIYNQLMWNAWASTSTAPTNWNFEISKSLIELNKKYWVPVFRIPSYFHDNIFNYNSFTDSNWNPIALTWQITGERCVWCVDTKTRMFWLFANTMKENKNMWLLNNRFNIYIPMAKNNFNWLTNVNISFFDRLGWADNKKFLIMNNEFNFLGSSNNYLNYFRENTGWSSNWWVAPNNVIFVNNKFSWLKEALSMTQPRKSPSNGYFQENVYFVNNSFDDGFIATNYTVNWSNPGWSYWSSTSLWFNNKNAFTTISPLWKNFNWNTSEKGLRLAADLNLDGLISTSEIISNSFCSPKPSCEDSTAPLLVIY